jgi:FKBP-type peptidyl-prolyl cis-trans isomerase FklB
LPGARLALNPDLECFMKLRLLALVVGMAASLGVAAQDVSTEKGKLSYAIGYEIGTDFVSKKMDVDVNTVLRAIQDGYAKKKPLVPEQQMISSLTNMRDKMVAEAKARFEQVSRENKLKSDKFLAENKLKKGIVTLPSGIQYRVIEEGTGKRPLKTSEVVMHYRGSKVNGLEFDSTFARGTPVQLKVGEAMKGWQEVLPLMKVGDQWMVYLPAEHALGSRGQGPIGPNEALVFDIKLVDVK